MSFFPYALTLGVSLLLSFLLPIVLMIWWKKKSQAKISTALVGALIFVVFVFGLESICHQFVLKMPFVLTNIWIYVLYGGLAAGLFEETGRFVAFRFLLKKRTGRETAVMYGIGHGGIEAILLAGLSCLVNMAALILVMAGSETLLQTVFASNIEEMSAAFLVQPAPVYLVTGIERVFAIALHISLSVLVFRAVRQKKFAYWLLAVLCHAAVDWIAMLYQTGLLTNIWLLEGLIGLGTVLVALLAFRSWRALGQWEEAAALEALAGDESFWAQGEDSETPAHTPEEVAAHQDELAEAAGLTDADVLADGPADAANPDQGQKQAD